MKLSKLQRHTAYIILLAEYEEHQRKRYLISQGFCWMIKVLFTEQSENSNWESNVNWFPELKAKKPQNTCLSGSWFDVDSFGRKKRIEILKKCIEETY